MSNYKLDKKSNFKPVPIESDWVGRIQAGDGAAFEKLFRMYCQPLVNFARRYVAKTETSENIVQDVFLRIWERRAQLNSGLNIKTYLFAAVKNEALKHLRHLEVERRSAEQIEQSTAKNPTPEDELNERAFAESVQRAIEDLPEKCRLIFSMNRFDQLTYKEIAEIQSLSIKTVETQMGRALKFLRTRLHSFLTIFPL
jgi:RNA polymerase sigma-70 factor (ECF subfamily)